jgi:hypothetical protein
MYAGIGLHVCEVLKKSKPDSQLKVGLEVRLVLGGKELTLPLVFLQECR